MCRVHFSSFTILLSISFIIISCRLVVQTNSKEAVPVPNDFLHFTEEPPHQVDFSNSSGARIRCKTNDISANITWQFVDGGEILEIANLRRVEQDGNLTFLPFKAAEYRQDVHTVAYRCLASNVIGTIVSRTVNVRAVVSQPYEVYIYDVYVIRGNGVLMKCHIPNFLKHDILVTSWIRDGAFVIKTKNFDEDEKYIVLPSGDLLIRNASASDSGATFRCQTTHRLTTENKTSHTAGKLIVTDPEGTVPPRINGNPTQIFSSPAKGETIILACVAQGHPVPTFSWTFMKENISSPVTLQTNERVKIEDGFLMIRNARKSDSGKYSCLANNGLGSIKIDNFVTVKADLSVTVQPVDHIIDVGKNAEFRCQLKGFPIKEFIWMKDGKMLTEKINHEKLVIEEVRREHTGFYQCFARNDYDEAQGIGRLILGDCPPSLVNGFSDQILHPGSTISLQCTASGNPLPQITWIHDGIRIPDQSIINSATGDGDILSSMKKTEIRTEDGGVYQCEARNRAGVITHAARIDVYGALGSRREINYSVVADSNATLHCPFYGYPYESIMWEKDNEILPRTRRFKRYRNGTLIIEKIQRSSDTGKYTCHVRNHRGETSSGTLSVTVMETPKIFPFTFHGAHVFQGVLARVSCVVYQGDLPITIQWFKDARPVSLYPDISVKIIDEFSSILTISSVQKNHSGNYTCIARNSAATEFQTARLVVNVPPKITPFSFQDDHLLEGMLVRVSCVVSRGDLPLRIKWQKDDRPIPSELAVTIRDFDEFSSVLNIDSVTTNHNGFYKCIASNDAGNVSFTAELTVKVPPRWIIKPLDIVVEQDEELTMDCKAEGFPPPRILWMRIDDMDMHGEGREIEDNENIDILKNGSLHIENASALHEGYYFCSASNGVGQDLNHVIFIDVQAPPIVKMKFSSQSARRNGQTKITCEASGDVPMEFNWKFEGRDIFPSQRFTLTTDVQNRMGLGQIIITQVLSEDNGNFSCRATNAHGTDEAIRQLIVQEPPGAPEIFTLHSIGNRTIHLTWGLPFHGNLPIKNYFIQYKPFKGSWTGDGNIISISGKEMSFKLKQLRPALTYVFRIQAENSLGKGPFSKEMSYTLDEEVPEGPPENIDIDSADGQSLRITWKPPHLSNGHIRGYYIGYKEVASSEDYAFFKMEIPEDYSEDLIYQLTDLKMFTQYSIVIQAYNNKGRGPLSDETISMTSEDVPRSAPQDVRCSALSSHSIYVIWEPLSSDVVRGILKGFKVFYKPVVDWYDSFGVSKVTTNPRLTLQELDINTNYSIEVNAFTRVGDGPKSLPIFCKTHEDVPGAPSEIRVLPSSMNSVLVSWKPPLKAHGTVSKYNVYMRALEEEFAGQTQYSKDFAETGDGLYDASKHIAQADALYHEIKNLDNKKRYEFWVTAASSIGEGPTSKVIGQSPTGPIVAPKMASFSDRIKTPWKRSILMPCKAVGIPPPIREWFKRGKPLNWDEQMEFRSDGSLIINKIDSSHAGNYTCKIHNPYGEDHVTYEVFVQVPPDAPILEILSKTLTSLRLRWKSTKNGGDPIKGYILHYKREMTPWEKKDFPPDMETHTISNLPCGAIYQLYLEAFNKIGIGSPTEVITVTTEGAALTSPAKEKLIREGSTYISLHLEEWKSGGCPINFFTAEYKKYSERTWTVISGNIKPAQKKLVVPGLSPATWYMLRVTAHSTASTVVGEYKFATLTSSGVKLKDASVKQRETVVWLYMDPSIIVTIILSIIIIIIVIIVACYYLKKKKNPKTVRRTPLGPGKELDLTGANFGQLYGVLSDAQSVNMYATLGRRRKDLAPYAMTHVSGEGYYQDQGSVYREPLDADGSCSTGTISVAMWKGKKVADPNQLYGETQGNPAESSSSRKNGIQETTLTLPPNSVADLV